MRQILVALMGLASLSLTGAAQAQSADDWDFGADPSRKLTVASIDYGTYGVAVRCMDGVVSLTISGLPEASGERDLSLSLAGGPSYTSQWISGRNSPVAFALWPRQLAGGLARGGTLVISAPDGGLTRRYTMDLPRSEQSVARTLAACGHTLEAPAPAGENQVGLAWVNPPRPTPSNRADYATYEQALAAVVCQIAPDGKLRDCEAESEFPPGSGWARASVVTAHREGRVRLTSGPGPIPPGRTIGFVSRLNWNDDLLPATPSRLPLRE